MKDIVVKPGKTMKRHIDGIREAIRTGINSAVVEGLNNRSKLHSSVPMASELMNTGIRSDIL